MGCRVIDPTMSVVLLLLCLGMTGVHSGASDHRYKPDETVPLYANKVGPFHNPR
jgi:transmembrane 9 superfamily member 1